MSHFQRMTYKDHEDGRPLALVEDMLVLLALDELAGPLCPSKQAALSGEGCTRKPQQLEPK